MRILLIEDDEALGSAVREHVASDGHAVDWVERLADADASIRAALYDLILLDLMLPDGRGVEFLRRRRASGDTTPVIILTARDQISDRIEGLNAGAEIDLASRAVYRSGRAVDLTAREWAIFEALVQRPGAILSKGQLEDRLYNFGVEIESNTIEVHISRLRRKLGKDVIETRRGLGYRLGQP